MTYICECNIYTGTRKHSDHLFILVLDLSGGWRSSSLPLWYLSTPKFSLTPTALIKKRQKYIADLPPVIPQIEYWFIPPCLSVQTRNRPRASTSRAAVCPTMVRIELSKRDIIQWGSIVALGLFEPSSLWLGVQWLNIIVTFRIMCLQFSVIISSIRALGWARAEYSYGDSLQSLVATRLGK